MSRAAERLFITHQCLSKYLSNLETYYGVTLFERKPAFSLTHEGRLMLDALRQVELTEKNLRAQYADLRDEQSGEIRIGTTEGRFRILMPDIITEFKKQFPEVQLHITSAPSPELRDMVRNNQLDLIVVGFEAGSSQAFTSIEVLQEKLYLVISDSMLKEYFPDDYPKCKETFREGADLRLFQEIPFALNMPNFNSRVLLKRHLQALDISLNCIHTSSHPDLHHMMSARDYAASFCLTMYLPSLLKLNEESGHNLNVFPIKDFFSTNPVVIVHAKNKIFPRHTKALIQIISRQCRQFSRYDLVP